ncbi:MAG: hypothetical protein GX560_04215, partial [Deinococcales bacterium]|nr:hypothetical protein [Deinococcales bacterium]
MLRRTYTSTRNPIIGLMLLAALLFLLSACGTSTPLASQDKPPVEIENPAVEDEDVTDTGDETG